MGFHGALQQIHSLSDEQLKQATEKCLNARKVALEQAAAEASQALRRYKLIAAREFGKSGLRTPFYFENAELEVSSIDISKEWDWHCQEMLKVQRGRQVRGWRMQPNLKDTKPNALVDRIQEIESHCSKKLPPSAQVLQLKKELKQQSDEASKFHAEQKLREPLIKIGTAVRRRFLEGTKRVRRSGIFINVLGTADVGLIETGNEAARRGDFEADAAMFAIGVLKASEDVAHFKKVYGIGPYYLNLNLSQKEIQIKNMCGTMISCASETRFTLDKARDIEFAELKSKCAAIKKAICEKHGSNIDLIEEKVQGDSDFEKACVRMKEIVDGVLDLAKRRRF